MSFSSLIRELSVELYITNRIKGICGFVLQKSHLTILSLILYCTFLFGVRINTSFIRCIRSFCDNKNYVEIFAIILSVYTRLTVILNYFNETYSVTLYFHEVIYSSILRNKLFVQRRQIIFQNSSLSLQLDVFVKMKISIISGIILFSTRWDFKSVQ